MKYIVKKQTPTTLKEILFGNSMIKSPQIDLLIKARGYPVGTIREWSGKKYKKTQNGKWMPAGVSGSSKKEETKETKDLPTPNEIRKEFGDAKFDEFITQMQDDDIDISGISPKKLLSAVNKFKEVGHYTGNFKRTDTFKKMESESKKKNAMSMKISDLALMVGRHGVTKESKDEFKNMNKNEKDAMKTSHPRDYGILNNHEGPLTEEKTTSQWKSTYNKVSKLDNAKKYKEVLEEYNKMPFIRQREYIKYAQTTDKDIKLFAEGKHFTQ